MSCSTLTRRSALKGMIGGSSAYLLGGSKAVSALDLPSSLAGSAAQTASTLASYYQSGFIPPSSLISHHGSGQSLFSYLAGSGWNATIPGMINQALPYVPNATSNSAYYISVAAQQIGIPLHAQLLDLVSIPGPGEVVNAVGGDMGYVQSTFSDALVYAVNTQNVSYQLKEKLMDRNRTLRRVLLSRARPETHLIKVVSIGNLLASAGVLVGGAAVLIAAAALAPAILGVGAFAAVTAGILYTAGVAIAAMGMAIAFYGMYNSLLSQGYGGGGGGGQKNCQIDLVCQV